MPPERFNKQMNKIRTRFAPSPTGYLHIGGARTALYSWLHARANDGEFVLRIEDTDLERSTPEAVEAIMDGMRWLELDWDEGPIFQTDRFDHYKEVIERLVGEDKAYPCFCSRERLDALRETQMSNKEKPRYDGKCLHLSSDEIDLSQDHVIRFKNPKDGIVTFNDVVKGEISIANKELDDLIIARTDGSPTYNFTVVVDDMDMEITQVVRGDDHINNTPRQINVFEALGVIHPEYGHVPMILGDDGKKLSKRHGAVSVMQYRDDGYLPHAVLNYLVRLGWSHGDQEIFSLEEMKELFDINKINKAPSAFNTDKLKWVNQHYIKESPASDVAIHLKWHFDNAGVDINTGPSLEEIIPVFAERANTLVELLQQSRFLYEDFDEFDEKAAKKNLRGVAAVPLEKLRENIMALNESEWKAEQLHEIVKNTAEQLEVGMGKVGQPLRVALVGHGQSPSIDLTLSLLGKEKTVTRIDKALAYIENRVANTH